MIDTLETQRSFLRSGFSEEQADTLIQALKDADKRAATSEELERGLKDVGGEIEKLRRDLTIKIYSTAFVVVGVMTALMALLLELYL